uniref:Uncharacterized protein n=1 Tax=Picea glauca TaxID=3330 RepID=A0A101LY30_PICGL|nr:hypothetical protein ABT39_MTgene5602 [Picea glauca]QHR87844.1 hypothetical protein Q903MT_gene1856 [Picea sitchensis]
MPPLYSYSPEGPRPASPYNTYLIHLLELLSCWAGTRSRYLLGIITAASLGRICLPELTSYLFYQTFHLLL